MKRVKQDDISPKSETPSPVLSPTKGRSPSPPANLPVEAEVTSTEGINLES
jgi:hypothetical protein